MATKKGKNSRPDSKFCTDEQKEEAVRESRPFFAGLTTPWEEFYRRRTERLSRIAAKMDVPPDQIEDVVSETWLDAVRHRDDFSTQTGLCCWLGKAVRNKVVDLFRRKAKRISAQSLDASGEELMEPMVNSKSNLDAKREQLSANLQRLREKKPKDTELLCAHYLKGRKLKHLAKKRRMTVDAIRNRISRALQDLRRLCEEKAEP